MGRVEVLFSKYSRNNILSEKDSELDNIVCDLYFSKNSSKCQHLQ